MLRKALPLVAFVAGSVVLGAPVAPAVTDTDVLQFALTLEHLESAFYADALAKYDAQAFADVGFPEWVRGRYRQIGEQEAAHVKFLSTALGAQATKPCNFIFPHNNPREFAELSVALENVGDSAYTGAAQLVSDKSILTAAASILSVEARHSAWISSATLKNQPWNTAFEAPLTPSGAFSLASLFIKDCPSSNPQLPVKSLPPLTLSNAAPAPGTTINVKFDAPKGADLASASVAWLDGLTVVYSDLNSDGSTVVPPALVGTVFAAVVSSQAEPPNDNNTLSGFTIAEFPFDSHAVFNE